jgi:hypothetical protein
MKLAKGLSFRPRRTKKRGWFFGDALRNASQTAFGHRTRSRS